MYKNLLHHLFIKFHYVRGILFDMKNQMDIFRKSYLIFTASVRSTTGGYVFTGVSLSHVLSGGGEGIPE